MNELKRDYPLTYEGTMAAIQDSNRFLTEKQAETDRQLKETDRLLKEERLKREKEMAEYDRQLKKEMVEYDRQLKKEMAKYDRQLKKEKAERDRLRERDNAAYEKRMKRMDKEMGRWTNNQGCFAEEYFYNSFDYGEQNFFGEHFDSISKGLKPKTKKLEDEYDIVLFNSTAVAIIEVKYKAHKNDVAQVLKKAETFKILCPDYKDFKIYLGLASMAFYPELEQECIEQGIAIIKQVGDTVVICDEHLKGF